MASAAVCSKVVVLLLLLTFCLLLLPLWESLIVLCFVVRYFISILVLQSSWWGRENLLFCLLCLPGVSWWLSGSSSQCHGFVIVVFPDHIYSLTIFEKKINPATLCDKFSQDQRGTNLEICPDQNLRLFMVTWPRWHPSPFEVKPI